MSDVGHLDYRLTDLQNTTETLQKTQNMEIGALFDDPAAFTHLARKLEDDIARMQLTLADQAETLSKLGRDQGTILSRADAFATAHVQADEYLNQLEAAPIIPVPKNFCTRPLQLLHLLFFLQIRP